MSAVTEYAEAQELFYQRYERYDLERFNRWLLDRPAIVQDLVRRFPPDALYRKLSTGQIVTVVAYSEAGTLRVYVEPDCAGPATAACEVYGVPPNDLVFANKEEVLAAQAKYAPLQPMVKYIIAGVKRGKAK
jgi:hypothetical protein